MRVLMDLHDDRQNHLYKKNLRKRSWNEPPWKKPAQANQMLYVQAKFLKISPDPSLSHFKKFNHEPLRENSLDDCFSESWLIGFWAIFNGSFASLSKLTSSQPLPKKAILCIWWCTGVLREVLCFEIVPDGRAITAETYSNQLGKVQQKIRSPINAAKFRSGVLLSSTSWQCQAARRSKGKLYRVYTTLHKWKFKQSVLFMKNDFVNLYGRSWNAQVKWIHSKLYYTMGEVQK